MTIAIRHIYCIVFVKYDWLNMIESGTDISTDNMLRNLAGRPSGPANESFTPISATFTALLERSTSPQGLEMLKFGFNVSLVLLTV